MYYHEMTEMTYREFVDAVATAKSKKVMRVKLSPKEKYLLDHAVSIEMAILKEEESNNIACPRARYGISDDTNDDSSIDSYYATFGASHNYTQGHWMM